MRSIIRAAIRIILIVFCVQLVLSLINQINIAIINERRFGYENSSYNVDVEIGILVAAFIIGIVILYFLWRKTDWLVRVLAGEMDDSVLTVNTTNLDLISVAIRLLGIYLLATLIPRLIGDIQFYFSIQEILSDAYASDKAAAIKPIIVNTITILIGAGMVMGTRRITKTIDKIMNLPVSDVEDDQE